MARANAPARQKCVAIFANLHPAMLRPVPKPIPVLITADSALIANALGFGLGHRLARYLQILHENLPKNRCVFTIY
jgi:hypothetical protein